MSGLLHTVQQDQACKDIEHKSKKDKSLEEVFCSGVNLIVEIENQLNLLLMDTEQYKIFKEQMLKASGLMYGGDEIVE